MTVPEISYVRALWTLARARLTTTANSLKHRGDAGYTTETVVVIALLVAMALATVAIITAKVLAKANSLNLG
jgi:hypothetical protein